MKKILLIAGTRPNFIKLAPLYHRLKSEAPEIQPLICHTGQHFDFNMSDIFWQNLELPQPDFQLNIKGIGVVDTIGKTLLGINEIIGQHAFNLVIVFGDVNATAAGAIAGSQSRIPVMHVEAGLRSYDRDMPEEINRVITDHVSDYLMVSEQSGIKNLQKEGIPDERMIMVGNIMIECLLNTKKHWENIKLQEDILRFYNQKPVVATFHRPENVDSPPTLQRMVEILNSLAVDHPVIFPVHPRTRARLEQHHLLESLKENTNILVTEPLSYFEFLRLVANARLVVTDSGGVQEETSFLNIACITYRKNTERPVTVEFGTNLLMNIWKEDYLSAIKSHMRDISQKTARKIPLWDGNVSQRIVHHIQGIMQEQEKK